MSTFCTTSHIVACWDCVNARKMKKMHLLCLTILQCGIFHVANSVDPEVFMTTSELIRYQGYPVENHDVTTTDGYILSVQRIPGPRHSANITTGKPVVLLMHGLLSCSACWVENLANESLGFILADAGYDVWLGNVRGNTYGLRNTNWTTNDEEFWEFSWDEMAKYDLPDTIDYILANTGQPHLSYVGHSQGTLIMFAGQSMNYVDASKVNLFVALGPAAYLAHVRSPVALLAALTDKDIRSMFSGYDFLPSHDDINWLGAAVCSLSGKPADVCENILFLLGGHDLKNMNESRIPVYVGQHPAGTSLRNMIHYAQSIRTENFQMFDYGHPENMKKYNSSIRTENFQMFDYGHRENMKKYNSTHPPKYKPEDVSIPVALFDGPNDWLTTLVDVAKLKSELPNVVFSKTIPDYEHLDYIWAVNAPQACYADIMMLLKKYNV